MKSFCVGNITPRFIPGETLFFELSCDQDVTIGVGYFFWKAEKIGCSLPARFLKQACWKVTKDVAAASQTMYGSLPYYHIGFLSSNLMLRLFFPGPKSKSKVKGLHYSVNWGGKMCGGLTYGFRFSTYGLYFIFIDIVLKCCKEYLCF